MFVANTWDTAVTILGSRPTQSRAGVPLLVGDITRKEGLQLLSHLGVTKPELASQGVDYVGTSFLLLERFAGLINALHGEAVSGGVDEKSLNIVKTKLLELAALEFESLGAVGGRGNDNKENQPIIDAIKAVLDAKQQQGKILPEMRRKLLSSTIFTYDAESRSIGFASKLAEEAAVQILLGGEGGKRKK